MLAIPGSVHIGSARSTRSAIQVLAPHLESAVFISCNLEPWRLGRDRFELREMFGRYSYSHTDPRGVRSSRRRCLQSPGLLRSDERRPNGTGPRAALCSSDAAGRLPEPHAPTGAVRDHEGGCWPSRALCTSAARVLRAPLSRSWRPTSRAPFLSRAISSRGD